MWLRLCHGHGHFTLQAEAQSITQADGPCLVASHCSGYNPSHRHVNWTYWSQTKATPVWTAYISSQVHMLLPCFTMFYHVLPSFYSFYILFYHVWSGWGFPTLATCVLVPRKPVDVLSLRKVIVFGGELQKKLLARQLWWKYWSTSIKASFPLGSQFAWLSSGSETIPTGSLPMLHIHLCGFTVYPSFLGWLISPSWLVNIAHDHHLYLRCYILVGCNTLQRINHQW